MATPHFEVPLGAVNGVNRTFFTVFPYLPTSVAIFINGSLHSQVDDDGWTETNPAAGQIDLSTAPQADDIVQVFYLDTVTPEAEELTPIVGKITSLNPVSGFLVSSSGLLGSTKVAATVSGRLIQEAPLLASISESDIISGSIDLES